MRLLSFIAFFSLALFSCKKEEDPQDLINNYLKENGLTAQSTASGLHYIITDPGTGTAHPNINSSVTMHYTGYLLNGNIFDGTAPTKPVTFQLAGLIKGWQEGIPLFKKGGKGKLILPPSLGYGSQATGGIPANSVLVFDIELLDFN